MEEITTTIETPDVILDGSAMLPSIRNYYRDEEERVYRLDHDITEEDLALVDLILRCNKEDKGKSVEERVPIKVYLSTCGGDVVTLWTLIQVIQTSKTPVWTINISFAYSAGAELLASGHKRFALKGTQTMFHRGSCFFGGEQSVVESTKKHFDGIEKKLTDFLMSHTKIDAKVYKKKASFDIYMDEDEALKNGVVDCIVDDFDILF